MNITARKPFAAGLILLTLMLSACGSSSSSPTPSPANTSQTKYGTPASPSTTNVDVCTLVSAPEMSQIVGETVTAQAKTLQTGIPACSYKAASGNPVPGVVIGIHKPNGKTTCNSAKSLYKGSPGNREVSGIGEQAFDSGDGALYALKGDSCLDIVLAQNPDLRFAQLKQIATLAVGRMP
jgi:ABC-type Fe3+-hydroxamate transport system substrate-binding protein